MSYRSNVFILASILFMVLLWSCATEDPNNFLINGQDLVPSSTEPKDSLGFISVNIGDTVTISNIMAEKVKKRKWDVDGDGKWDEAFNNKAQFSTIVRKEGMRKISLSIDGSKKKVSKWIEVVEEPKPTVIINDLPMPSFAFESPVQKFNVSNKRVFSLRANLENIFEDDDLKLLVNDKEEKYDLDEVTGELTKNIKLNKGENNIELRAMVDDEMISSIVTIDYDPNGDAYIADVEPTNKPTLITDNYSNTNQTATTKISNVQKPTEKVNEPNVVVDLKPKVRFASPVNNSTTDKANQIIGIKTENIPEKQYLVIMLNGDEIKDFNFSPNAQTASLNVKLKEGDNNITMIGQNDEGIVQSKLNVKYSPTTVTDITPVNDPDPIEIIEDPGGAKIDNPIVDPSADKAIQKIGNTYSTAGMSLGDFSSSCAKKINESYIFYVTPKQALELSEFTVFTDNCGGLEIILQTPTTVNRTKAALVKGKNQIVLNDLNLILQSGIKYKITCKPISGYGNCKSSTKPKLLDIAECNKKSTPSSKLTADFMGKSVIYKLEYRY